MYNLNLLKNEETKIIVDNILISSDDNSKTTTIALTNQRLLFLDNFDDVSETLRVSRGVDYLKEKDVYHTINITDITSLKDNVITLKDSKSLIIDSDDIIITLKELI